MEKDTGELLNDIKSSDSFFDYIGVNSAEMTSESARERLVRLIDDRGLSVGVVASKSSHKEYIYKVFAGSRPPRRDIIVCISLAMGISVDETQGVLRLARCAPLDPRSARDAGAIYAIHNRLTEVQLNDMLFEIGEEGF